jgi:hypothetical protein
MTQQIEHTIDLIPKHLYISPQKVGHKQFPLEPSRSFSDPFTLNFLLCFSNSRTVKISMSLWLTPLEFSEPKETTSDVPFHEENSIRHNGVVSNSLRVRKYSHTAVILLNSPSPFPAAAIHTIRILSFTAPILWSSHAHSIAQYLGRRPTLVDVGLGIYPHYSPNRYQILASSPKVSLPDNGKILRNLRLLWIFAGLFRGTAMGI